MVVIVTVVAAVVMPPGAPYQSRSHNQQQNDQGNLFHLSLLSALKSRLRFFPWKTVSSRRHVHLTSRMGKLFTPLFFFYSVRSGWSGRKAFTNLSSTSRLFFDLVPSFLFFLLPRCISGERSLLRWRTIFAKRGTYPTPHR